MIADFGIDGLTRAAGSGARQAVKTPPLMRSMPARSRSERTSVKPRAVSSARTASA